MTFQKGHKVPKEWREIFSKAHKGQPSPMKGKHHSEETKKRMSEARKGKPNPKHSKTMRRLYREGKFIAPMKGRKQTEEHKRKMVETRMKNNSYVVSEEQKIKLKKARQERKKKFGYINSPEARRKISLSQIGRIQSKEARKKMSEAQKLIYKNGRKSPMFGKHHTEETREKLSNTVKEAWQKGKFKNRSSEEWKQKISLANKGKRRTKETKRKMSERMKGKYIGANSPSFKGYPSGYGYDFYLIRKHSLKFYGYRCVECGITNQEHIEKSMKGLGIHHKDGNKKNNTIENCVPMCVSCHSKQRIHHHKDFEILSLDKFKEGNYENRDSNIDVVTTSDSTNDSICK